MLISGVRGIDDATQEILIPLPVAGVFAEKLLTGQAGGMDAHPSFALFDELLQGLLLGVGHVKGGEVEHDEDLVAGQVCRIYLAGIIGEIQCEIVLGGHLLEKRPGGGNHLQVIVGP